MSNEISLDPNLPLTGSTTVSLSAETNDLVAEKMPVFETIYIPFPRQVEFHSRCDFLAKLGKATRGKPQKGLRVLAPTGSGKTISATAFVEMVHPPGTPGKSPIAHVALEKDTTSKRLMSSILQWFRDPLALRGTEAVIRERLYAAFREFETQLLIIDEVQHLNFRSSVRSDPTDTLKRFLDDGMVPVVFLGTEGAEDMFRRNLQLNSRLLPPCDLLPLSRMDKGDRALLHQFLLELDERIVQLGLVQQLSGLAHPWIRGCLWEVSGGIIGRISRIMYVALEGALRRGAERIEVYDLARATDSWAVAQGFIGKNPFRQPRPQSIAAE